MSPVDARNGDTVEGAGADRPVVVEEDQRLAAAVAAVCRRVAPVWPLSRFVAVNPYLGLADLPFDVAAERLASVAGARATLDAGWYLDLLTQGRIGREDLAAVLADRGVGIDPDEFVARLGGAADDQAAAAARVPTVGVVAAAYSGTDWAALATDRVAAWAAAYFDEGQASWRSADGSLDPYTAWREEATVDRTPEVAGLRGFRAAVRTLDPDPLRAIAEGVTELGVADDVVELYLHALLLRVGGWAAHAARLVWEADLAGRQDDTLVRFLAVLVGWEVATARCLAAKGFREAWEGAMDQLDALGPRPEVRDALSDRLLLQEAFDRAEQRRLTEAINAGAHEPVAAAPQAPTAQLVCCIDVRSEVFRRHVEAVAPEVETIGFAGFFGFPIEYVPLAHDEGEAQCPVLLSPAYTVAETAGDPDRQADAVAARRLSHHVRRAWKSFKMGAISCFSFVGPVGLAYLPKMFSDAYGRTRPVRPAEDEGLPSWAVEAKAPTLARADGDLPAPGIPADGRLALAQGALGAMSLTDGFAPLVVIAGHGATTTNNPYDTGLDCGACGGHTGEANARVAAAVLNDPTVRAALADQGIEVPDTTWFVAAQHNTTTDQVTVFDRALLPATHVRALATLEEQLAAAGAATRAERARRLNLAPGADVDRAVLARAADWAQVRPEWGLAGCRAFVVAPRRRTRSVDLGGRSFLHSYEWRQDQGFGVLELIMTAPMVVASWISLQYYASTVENRLFGSGNKTLHNVVGRLGVLEGNAGDLRVGLPWQSVHDGERYQHEPVRLNVIIEAPIDAMNEVLGRHDGVRDLVDNGWVHLLAMDDDGTIGHRYVGGLRWEPLEVV